MEYVKQWYLQNLLSHLNQTGLNISMLSLVRDIKEFPKRARECYQEPIDLDQNEFIEMMIIVGWYVKKEKEGQDIDIIINLFVSY